MTSARPRPTRPAIPRETFTLRPSAAGGWVMVEAALARKLVSLAEVPVRLAVIVTPEDGQTSNHFTQALVDREGGAWVEAAGNPCITSEAHRLDDDQHLLLEAFGFAPPAAHTPNHFLIFSHDVAWAEVARLLVQPLEAVYGIPAEGLLKVSVFPVGPACPFSRGE